MHHPVRGEILMNIVQDYKRSLMDFPNSLVVANCKMLATHDLYTMQHCENVGLMAKNIANVMNLDLCFRKKSYLAGLVHDIGKGYIDYNLLNKKGSLTAEEISIFRKHSQWGYYTLRGFDGLSDIAEYVLCHHERWDGKGYPFRLAGKEIPLISQILSVVDAWDAMTNNRSYRSALAKEEAIYELKNGRGSQFSPDAVDAFLYLLD